MDKLIYTAASGMKAHLASQASIANNMANASTIGFRADRMIFDQLKISNASSFPRQPASESVTDFDRRAGTVNQTGRPLDIAVKGEAWIAVQGSDGLEAYTRRGDLQVAASGVLETGDGFPGIGSGGLITRPRAQKVRIRPEGVVSIVPQGSGSDGQPQVIDPIKLVSDKGTKTTKGLDNLLHVEGGGVLPADLNARVVSGALEQSNVNLTQSLVDMIENQRSYEVQANLIKETKNLDESSAQLMRLPG